MNLSAKAHAVYEQLTSDAVKHGDIRKIAKEIKKDHDLALELWTTGAYFPMQLAILIMDKKQLTQEVIDQLDQAIQQHPEAERTHLADWLMANQLMKDKKLVALIESWEHSPSFLQRRIYWYYQGRLRWTGKLPSDDENDLLAAIEQRMLEEHPDVQWAMNFTAGWIGVYQPAYRSQIVAFGERLGLYKDQKVPKNCTPNYLPKFVEIEVAKRG